MFTPEFFAAIGKLAFQFTRLEGIVGLCIEELEPRNQKLLVKIWRPGFQRRLDLLKEELHHRVGDKRFDFIALERLCTKAATLARKRNNIMHGSLRFLPEFDWHFFNRTFAGSYSCEPTAIDQLRNEVEALAHKFGVLRGDCMSIRWEEERKSQAK